MKKALPVFLIIIMLMTAVAGCTAAEAYKDIKQQPGVMDIAVYAKNNDIKLEVIMEDDADLSNVQGLAEGYGESLKEKFSDKNITVNMIQKRQTIYSHSL